MRRPETAAQAPDDRSASGNSARAARTVASGDEAKAAVLGNAIPEFGLSHALPGPADQAAWGTSRVHVRLADIFSGRGVYLGCNLAACPPFTIIACKPWSERQLCPLAT
jgi:hypothetical protein